MNTKALEGENEIIERMQELERRVQRRSANKATRRGAWVIARKARENAKAIDDPNTPENIAKNITVQSASRLGRREGGAAMRVGVRGGAAKYASTRENVRRGRVGKAYATGGSKTNPGGDTYYWRFLEFGTSRVSAKPFMRPAIAQSAQDAFNETASVLDAEITKELESIK